MSKINEFLTRCIENKVFPGATFAIGTSEKILEQGFAGTLGVGRPGVNMDTMYDMASVTKPISALALMKLFEDGYLCLDDTIDRFLPEFVGHEKGKITIFQLLTHTSVIPGQIQIYRTCRNRQDILEAIKYYSPRDNFHTQVMYSSQGLILIGEIIEHITGKTLDTVLDEYLFTPFDMKRSMFNPPEELHDNIASTEDCPWRGHVLTGQVHDENAVVYGGICAHAGLFSTAPDMAKICQAMLCGKYPDSSRLLHKSTIELMTKNHTPGTNLARGLGWQCRDKRNSPAGDLLSDKSYGHTGFTGTCIWMDPEKDFFAVLLTNRVNPSRNGEGIVRSRQIFHNLSVLSYF